ncbi:MAG TPA: hypothetical protein EYG79_08335, partial [Rhodobacteraceae bacterium]|nr:hypothetical protein [Paracoccaceae bacterium]
MVLAEFPRLKDDCFALPEGTHWTPVDEALAHLRTQMRCVVGAEMLPVVQASGRILAKSVVAQRANPPYANAAVDGYAFAFASLTDEAVQALPLVAGRSAAGVPYDGIVPAGQALRILTGASLPMGVDTVIMQEDVQVEGSVLRFESGLKPGANCRAKGEDIAAGDIALGAGTRLGPQELG